MFRNVTSCNDLELNKKAVFSFFPSIIVLKHVKPKAMPAKPVFGHLPATIGIEFNDRSAQIPIRRPRLHDMLLVKRGIFDLWFQCMK